MQKIIVEKLYKFLPPYTGTFWPSVFRAIRIHDYLLRKTEGVVAHEIRHIERLRASLFPSQAFEVDATPCPFYVVLARYTDTRAGAPPADLVLAHHRQRRSTAQGPTCLAQTRASL